ncbi:hypothetical protein NQ176_g9598 [Zarea fungicola]|uniref:Uncharacterized protein n=1 Tax=Zarea fungicola TaxID=93591 RepID=A0ACC1MMR9_9HYPO|nr:hypothetical protein NQ176_g9598 [Lecanicillium fungicola]
MAPRFFNYPGTETNSEHFHYSQAVKIGNTIRTSGQGGWDATGNIELNLEKQIEISFANALQALQGADSRLGFEHIYAIRSYHVDLFPNHRPIWTCVEIGKLGLEGMLVEIEVEAEIPA